MSRCDRGGRGGFGSWTHRDEDGAGVGVDLVESVARLQVVQHARLVEVVELHHVLLGGLLAEAAVGSGDHLVPGSRNLHRDLIALDGGDLAGDVGLFTTIGKPYLDSHGDGVHLGNRVGRAHG